MKNKQVLDRLEAIQEKSEELIKSLEKAKLTREKIYLFLEKNTSQMEEDDLLTASEEIKKVLSMGDESYQFLTVDIPNSDIDRTKSMLCGPLYCSKKFPHPINLKGKKLIPILQIDLKWLSAMCGKQLGDEMLQVWFDHELTSRDLACIRLIPMKDIRLDRLIDFDEGIWTENNRIWIPGSWVYPDGKSVKQITGVKSFGFTVPDFDNILYNYFDGPFPFYDDLTDDLRDLANSKFNLKDNGVEDLNCHLFGDFYAIQMSAADFYPNSLFVSIRDFADGNAQIFRSPSGEFSFYAAN